MPNLQPRQRDSLTVYGYIRRISNTLMDIPMDLTPIFLGYYPMIYLQWTSEVKIELYNALLYKTAPELAKDPYYSGATASAIRGIKKVIRDKLKATKQSAFEQYLEKEIPITFPLNKFIKDQNCEEVRSWIISHDKHDTESWIKQRDSLTVDGYIRRISNTLMDIPMDLNSIFLDYYHHDTLESKYFIIRNLGKGAVSKVKLAQNRETEKEYAVKIINRNLWQRMKHATQRNVTLLDEVEIMKKLNHRNIVKVYEYFEEEKVVNIVLDYCGGGNMWHYILHHGAYNSVKARRLFKQLIDSVDYLHSLKIAHRDLKPENILLTDKTGDELKLTDFGISREETSAGCETVIGTPLYQAPEVHLRRTNGTSYDGTLADYWSLGIILYVMLVAATPRFPDEIIMDDEPIPDTAKDLIYRLLQTEPTQRITAKDIYEHPWMIGCDTFDDVPLLVEQKEKENPGKLTKSPMEDRQNVEELEHEDEDYKHNATPDVESDVDMEDQRENIDDMLNEFYQRVQIVDQPVFRRTGRTRGSSVLGKRTGIFNHYNGAETSQPPPKKLKRSYSC